MTLRIGVIGHRPNRISGCDPNTLQHLLETALLEIAEGVQGLVQDAEVAPFFSADPPELRVVTGIAYGIDEMAMKAVLALSERCGGTQAWRLELVSPAPLGIAAAHAWDDRLCATGPLESQIAALRQRWDWVRASADSIAELAPVWKQRLDGDESGIPDALVAALAVNDEERAALAWGIEEGYGLSYAPAGQFLLRNIDLLLAFWDGGPNAGRGGTVDLIDLAHAGGLPVVLTMLDALEAGPRQVLAIERAQIDRDVAGRGRPMGRVGLAPDPIRADRVAATLKPLLAPPSAGAGHERAGSALGAHNAHGGHDGNHELSLADYLEERLTPFESSRTYDHFLDFWLGRTGKALGAMFEGLVRRTGKLPLVLISAVRKPSRARMDATYRLKPRRPEARHHWAEQDWHRFLACMPALGLQTGRITASLLPRYIVADELAVDYANRYRSSVILSYLMSTLAVILAIVGLAFAADNKLLKAALLVAEFAIIVWVLVMVSASRRDKHHSKLVTYRALAERLRQMLFLAPLGELPPVWSRQAGPQDWETWYRLATARELGIPSGTFDRKHLRSFVEGVASTEITPQVAYHRRSAQKLSASTHRLHAFGDALFLGTLASVALSLLLIAGHLAVPGSWWTVALKFAGCAAAILPAVGAALTGIRYALDLETKAERHEEMANLLEQLSTRLDDVREQGLWSGTRDVVSDLADLLMREVSQFQNSYGKRAITVPA
jgi:hypothetical protein